MNPAPAASNSTATEALDCARPPMRGRHGLHGWTLKHLALALFMVAAGVAATFPAWADIFRIAHKDEESSHIFLVPLVIAWLIFVRRGRLRHCQPRASYLGPIAVLAGWAISTWGYYNAVQSFWHGGAVLVAVGCLISVVGRDLLFRFFPAFFVLIFLVPIPGMVRQQIAIPMQTRTAQASQVIFELMAIPVERSGNQLSVNDEPITIAEACNGLRMVFTLVLVSYAFAFGEPLRNYVRLLILLASPLFAIACNVIRIIPTVLLYGYAEQGMADTFHELAGWVMLVVALLLLMGIKRILEWALIPVTQYTLASD